MLNNHPWQPDKYQCELRFYDRRQQLLTKFETYDGWTLANSMNKHLIDTAAEFYIHIEAQLRLAAYLKYSFIEVFYKDQFIQRQFVRGGVLCPQTSKAENRAACPYLREKLIGNEPMIDWHVVMSDSFWKKPKYPLSHYLCKTLAYTR